MRVTSRPGRRVVRLRRSRPDSPTGCKAWRRGKAHHRALPCAAGGALPGRRAPDAPGADRRVRAARRARGGAARRGLSEAARFLDAVSGDADILHGSPRGGPRSRGAHRLRPRSDLSLRPRLERRGHRRGPRRGAALLSRPALPRERHSRAGARALPVQSTAADSGRTIGRCRSNRSCGPSTASRSICGTRRCAASRPCIWNTCATWARSPRCRCRSWSTARCGD